MWVVFFLGVVYFLSSYIFDKKFTVPAYFLVESIIPG